MILRFGERVILVIFSILLSYGVQAQVKKDSLLKVWENENVQDIERLEALKALIDDFYLYVSADSTRYYASAGERFCL